MKLHPLALLTATTLAAPQPQPRGYGLAARLATRTRQTLPLQRFSDALSNNNNNNNNNNNSAHIQYSTNWAGAVYESPPSASGTFTAVSATVTVPVPTATAAGSSSASAWVGIDGDTYGGAILQTGVDFTVTTTSAGRSSYSYDAWYEWYPDYAHDFSLGISAGDVVALAVTATSATAGVAVIENLTTGERVSKTITSSAALGGQNAEWIVEDYASGGALVPFADFGTVVFTGAGAETAGGGAVGTGDATVIDIRQSGRVLTAVTIPSDSEVDVTYE